MVSPIQMHATIVFVSCLMMLVNGDVISIEEVILAQGVAESVFPGAVAAYGRIDNVEFVSSVGSFTYESDSSPMQTDTFFDVASLTKVIATTSAVAILYEEGHLPLDRTVTSILGESFNEANASKSNMTIEHCLLHTAGYPPDPDPWYWSNTFACPETEVPLPEDFSCLPNIYINFMNQFIEVEPGLRYEYSDLSFITLQFIIGTIVLDNDLITPNDYSEQCNSSMINTFMKNESDNFNEIDISCAYEAFVRSRIMIPLLPTSGFLPDQSQWQNTAPTMNDTEYTMITPLQGQVGDGDCFAMGGIAGHAGLFSTLTDVSRFAIAWLQQTILSSSNQQSHKISSRSPPIDHYSSWLPTQTIVNETTARLFTQLYDASMSSRAFGWDTNAANVNDYGFDGVCGDVMSNYTFLHIGYTGTCLCVDPDNGFWSVILTNRVYGCQGQLCPDGSEDAVKEVYRQFNSAAAKNSLLK